MLRSRAPASQGTFLPLRSEAMRTPDVIALGETMLSLVAVDGPLTESRTLHVTFGGAEANTCAGLVRLGVSAAWVSRLGADVAGRHVHEAIDGCGVDVRWVRWDPDRPTGLMLRDTRGTVVYYRGGSAASALGPGDLDAVPVEEARAVLVTGVTALIGPDPQRAAIVLLDRATGLRVVDPNIRPGLWGSDRAKELIAPLVERADVLLGGERELAELAGDLSGAALAHACRAFGPREIAVKRGERGAGGLDEAVVRVEHRDHPPSVERAARVRDAALHQIADVERDALLDTQERMLIVEVRHDAAVERSQLARARPDRHGDRHALVERNVATPETDDRHPALRSRQHGTPHLHGRAEPRGTLGLAGERRQPLVQPGIVRQVATGPQDDPREHIAAPHVVEAFHDHVEERASAGGEDDAVVEPATLHERLAEAAHRVEVLADAIEACLRAVPADESFVPGDTGEPKRARCTNAFSHTDRFLHRSRAGAAAGIAELDENIESSRRVRVGQTGVQGLHPARRVDVAEKLDLGFVERARRPVDRRAIDELVGDHDPPYADLAHHPRLRGGARRGAPRTGRDLSRPELRRHGRLPVRRQVNAGAVAECRHQREVVAKRFLAKK